MTAPSQVDPVFLARRRWARVGWIYGTLLFIGTLFIGTLYVAFITSLKDDPLEQPFRFLFPQLSPRNWAAAWQLGQAGARDPWLGGFAPGAEVPFTVTYFVPEGREAIPPEVRIPRRKPGAGLGAVREGPYAADYAEVSPVEEVARRPGTYRGQAGTFVRYRFTVRYVGDGPRIERLPADLEVPRGQRFVEATLAPNRIERRGRVASWDNLTPGFLGYVFHNYVRVFREARSLSTGESLFWRWTLNSFYIAFFTVIGNLLFGSMAGYALARLRFPGRHALFLFMLFSMMVPFQVIFISNYLVLRDGIFGLTRLFGLETLLNHPWGVIVPGIVGSSSVFIMKQFFESIPKEIEEAALIDGATPFQTFFRVVLPISTPALGALTILTFQGSWNSFFWPLVVLTSPQDVFTLPVGLLAFRQAYGVAGDWGLILAGAFLSMIPIVVLFVVFQRYFVEGVSFSGLKG
ncbi:carbohydrate ABC transporter permease [Marinithermus hydrothermalis]|uniref:ABC-type transporter, integral membrane subunit n=1 Tax=Marinithermus hydrothermalis (strain DSM 14884 / JCM 11576 / T1) TaxID=869210 RepID=F2NR90_MARHT|nr:carbohydrate ABC transporter permease [Marinithermus hydrothermalis]AEB12939.1 ABC-type transporter, integral membrane subunit [Marinithermus hydrothermalis DSM 14884]